MWVRVQTRFLQWKDKLTGHSQHVAPLVLLLLLHIGGTDTEDESQEQEHVLGHRCWLKGAGGLRTPGRRSLEEQMGELRFMEPGGLGVVWWGRGPSAEPPGLWSKVALIACSPPGRISHGSLSLDGRHKVTSRWERLSVTIRGWWNELISTFWVCLCLTYGVKIKLHLLVVFRLIYLYI